MYLQQESESQATERWRTPGRGPAQIAMYLRDLASFLEAGVDAEIPIFEFGLVERPAASSDCKSNDRIDYLANVRSVVRARTVRVQILGSTAVDDPAWSILLDLFEAFLTQRTRCVKSVTIASGAPMTTALRYLALLGDVGLIVRRADPTDRRRILVCLSEIGQQKMIRYFDLIR